MRAKHFLAFSEFLKEEQLLVAPPGENVDGIATMVGRAVAEGMAEATIACACGTCAGCAIRLRLGVNDAKKHMVRTLQELNAKNSGDTWKSAAKKKPS